jgi:hypothetical protein
MIAIENIQGNTIRLRVSGKLEESDFRELSARVDPILRAQGQVRLLIDATAFDGWADRHAAAKHFTFVREHQKKVERIAIVAGHDWQHWIAGIAGVFVHPEIKVFDKGEAAQAESWLAVRKAA